MFRRDYRFLPSAERIRQVFQPFLVDDPNEYEDPMELAWLKERNEEANKTIKMLQELLHKEIDAFNGKGKQLIQLPSISKLHIVEVEVTLSPSGPMCFSYLNPMNVEEVRRIGKEFQQLYPDAPIEDERSPCCGTTPLSIEDTAKFLVACSIVKFPEC